MQHKKTSGDQFTGALWGDCFLELTPIIDPYPNPKDWREEGATAELSESGADFFMHKSCSCGAPKCPWCCKDITQDRILSQHEKLKLLKEWQSIGYEEGAGAPNLRLGDGSVTICAWYNRMVHWGVVVTHTLSSDEIAERHLATWVRCHARAFAIASLDRWAQRARHVLSYERATNIKTRLAETLSGCPEHDLGRTIKEVRKTLLPV